MFVFSCFDFDFVLRFERTNGNPGMEKTLEVGAQLGGSCRCLCRRLETPSARNLSVDSFSEPALLGDSWHVERNYFGG